MEMNVEADKVTRGEPIKKVTLKDGRTRYRVVVDGGVTEGGKRRQLTRTFNTKKEATTWLAKTRIEVQEGSFVGKTNLSVKEYLDLWLDGRELLHENTREGYRSDLKPVYEKFGHLPLQGLTSAMLIGLKQEMRTTGGRKGTGRSPRTIELLLTLLSMALEAAKDSNLVRVNVAAARFVERPKGSDFQGDTLSEAEISRFLEHVRGDRYEAAWRLSLCGMRRSEILGLTWGAIDLEAGTLSVRQSRTPRKGTGIGNRGTVIDAPKRKRSVRSIPLPSGVVSSLKAFRRRQQEERLRFGQVLGVDDFLVVDELGSPIHPDTYSRWFKKITKASGTSAKRLHDARRTAATLLSTKYGVSADAAASYLGHDPLTYHRTYVMGDRGHDAVRDALSRMQTGTDDG